MKHITEIFFTEYRKKNVQNNNNKEKLRKIKGFNVSEIINHIRIHILRL